MDGNNYLVGGLTTRSLANSIQLIYIAVIWRGLAVLKQQWSNRNSHKLTTLTKL